jgi:hypothetical protein
MIADDHSYEQLKFARRQAYILSGMTGDTSIYLASPEDLIVNKLRWCAGVSRASPKSSGEISWTF